MNSIIDAQENMREAYLDGAPGMIASGLVWCIAGLITLFIDPQYGMLALILGGMGIFPLSVVLCKAFGRSGKHDKENPLAPLAMEGTFWMLLSIPIAVVVYFYKVELFFPAMLLVIGGRYLTFNTLYGMRIYWVIGLSLAASGFALAMGHAPAFAGGIIGGGIELIFSMILMMRKKSN